MAVLARRLTCMRASKLVMSTPLTWISRGTGRTPGAKLKVAWPLAPIHSPTSRALAREWGEGDDARWVVWLLGGDVAHAAGDDLRGCTSTQRTLAQQQVLMGRTRVCINAVPVMSCVSCMKTCRDT